MDLYSYKGKEPEVLPEEGIKTEFGKRTGLDQLSNEELFEIGFVGPIEKPEIDEDVYKLIWNSENYTYQIQELSEQEIIAKKIYKINYSLFINKLKESVVFEKILNYGKLNMKFLYDFVEIESMINYGQKINFGKVQNWINVLFLTCDLNENDIDTLNSIFIESDMVFAYTIPNYQFKVDNLYDENLNIIYPKESAKIIE